MSRKTVLVVEDNEHDREIYGKLLWYNGFNVVFAEDGREGLEKAREQRPDAVVLDLILPKLGGLDVCALLKSDETTRDIPVLALTCQSENDYGPVARRLGCSRYMEKPASPVEVLHAVEDLVGRPPAAGLSEEDDAAEAVDVPDVRQLRLRRQPSRTANLTRRTA